MICSAFLFTFSFSATAISRGVVSHLLDYTVHKLVCKHIQAQLDLSTVTNIITIPVPWSQDSGSVFQTKEP